MSDDLDLVGRVRLDTSGLHEGVSAISSSLGKIATLAAGAFAIDKLVGFGKAGIGVAADMQQTSIAFETMLGSGQKAQSFLKDLRNFAAATPFEFPELATAASSLISVGVESSKIIPIMTSLGNATAGMGTGSEGIKRATVALQQMSAAGRITGEDLNQLRDAGIPVFDLLSAATGKSKEAVAALAQQGKLGKKELDQLFAALESGKGLERFNGLMEKQSHTLNGVISTLKDTLSNIAIDFITPYLPAMTDALQGFATFLQAQVVPFLHETVDTIVELGHQLAPVFDAITQFVADNPFPVLAAGVVILAGAIGVALVSAVTALIGVLGAVLSPIVLVIAAIAAIAAGVVYAYEHFATFRDIVDTAIAAITAAIQHLYDFGQEIWPQVQEAATHVFNVIAAVVAWCVDTVTKLWSIFGGSLTQMAQGTWDIIHSIIAGAIDVIANVIRLGLAIINGDWGKAWDALKGIVRGAMDAVDGILRGAGDIIAGIVKGWGAGINAAAGGAFEGIKDAFKAAINWVIDKWNGISFTTPSIDFAGQHIGGSSIGVPKIPRLKEGGTALSDGFAIVGDGGNGSGTELAYLRRGTTIDPRLPQILNAATGGSNNSGDVKVDLHFYGDADADSIRTAIPDLVDAIRAGVGGRRP